jgi:hypothetical protein
VKGNDLSNQSAPRHVIIFENGMAFLREDLEPDYRKFLRQKRYFQAAGCWVFREPVLSQIVRLSRTADINVEVCTWTGYGIEYDEFALGIADELDRLNVPVRSVWSSTPDVLARALSYLPDIAAVYDPDPGHVLRYGKRGVLLANANQIGRT